MKKGFTLIELLIVIGILAVLATVTVLVLNPAELFRQARDSQRISDLGSLKGAISLYLTTITSPTLQANSFDCTTKFGSDKTGSANPFVGGLAAAYAQATPTSTDVTGNGWVPVPFSLITGGSPLSVLPHDPNATDAALYYAYACNNTNLTFEINAHMESQRYHNGGGDDVESTDGGNQALRYEVGTYPSFAL